MGASEGVAGCAMGLLDAPQAVIWFPAREQYNVCPALAIGAHRITPYIQQQTEGDNMNTFHEKICEP